MNEKENSADPNTQLQALIAAIEEAVPREGAWVQLTQYGGGPDEGKIIGNENGYRRLGIEFLKATLAENAEQGFHVDIESLITPSSTILFDWFEISETPSPVAPATTWYERLLQIGCLGLLTIAMLVFIVGVGTVVQWMTS